MGGEGQRQLAGNLVFHGEDAELVDYEDYH